MNEEDAEFDRARQKSQGRFRSAFEAIFEKYGKLDEEDDIIDLLTEQIVVDNGRIRGASVIELGDLLHYPGSPTKSKSVRSRKRRFQSTEARGYGRARSSGSLSPELLSTRDLLKQQLENNNDDSAYDRDSDSESGSSELDLNFAPYTRLLNQRRGRTQQRPDNVYNSSEDEGGALNYESSDSLGTEQETPIDVYFTSSIEQYLEKLRHQMLPPAPTSFPTDAEMDGYGDWSAGESEADNTSQMSLSDHSTGQKPRHMQNHYTIPSSPRTMSPRSPRRAVRSFENIPPGNNAHSDNFYVSETSSQESDLASEEESVAGSISSSESIIGSVVAPSYGEYPETAMVGDGYRRQSLYNSTDFEVGVAADSIDANYKDLGDDEDCSEEELLDTAAYNPGGYSGQAIYSDFSPTFIHSTRESSEYPSYQPASLPPKGRQSAFERQPEQTNRRQHLHSSQYSNGGLAPLSHRPSATITRPVLFKPQPVSPHVFFDFDEPSSKRRRSYLESPTGYANINNEMGIGVTMADAASTSSGITNHNYTSSRHGDKDNPRYQQWHF